MLIFFSVMAQTVSDLSGAAPSVGGDFLGLVLDAGLIVQVILAGLLVLSVGSWGIMAAKAREFRRAIKESEKFADLFADRKNFGMLFKEIEKLDESHLAWVFRTGYTELVRVNKLLESRGLRGSKGRFEILLENVDRAVQGGVISKRKRMQRLLPLLATTGSTAPFIGLFGTVWGIMSSFQEIGMKGSANLAVVAPGISEALIATAMGLAAAIPAVVAYNHFSNKILMIEDDMLQFSSDFLNSLRTDLMCEAGEQKAQRDNVLWFAEVESS